MDTDVAPGSSCSRARPATSAAACCGRSRRAGERVRCLVAPAGVPARARRRRRPRSSRGDVLDRVDAARRRSQGVDTAYYLVHSMGSRELLRGARPPGGARLRARRRDGRRAADRLPRRPRRGRRDLSQPPRQPPGGRARSSRESGVPTIEFRASIVIGSGSALVRDDPRARRAAAGDGDAALGGARSRSRSRSRTCSPTWSRRSTSTAARAPCSRSAAPTASSYGDLMREYARQRGLRRAHGLRAGADAAALEPLARSRHAGLRPHRPEAGRQPAQRDRRRRRPGARATSRRSPARPYARGDRARARQRGPRVRRDALVGRGASPVDPGCGGARFGSRLVDSRAMRGGAPARRGVRADPPHRRHTRLVLRRRALAAARRARPARRRRRACGAGAAIPRRLRSATRSTSGASRRSSPTGSCGCAAEMKLPGRAWLAVRGRRATARGSTIRQTAIFDPVGRRRASRTGTGSGRSTSSSSPACCAGSNVRFSAHESAQRRA